VRAARRLVLAALACAVVPAAYAATVTGTNGPDLLRGTPGNDAIFGRGGDDVVDGLAGDDFLGVGPGRDTAVGGPGNDRLALHADGARDTARCGGGIDVVNAELTDLVAKDCEVVSRQLSRDPYTDLESQHETQVEPDSFAAGSTVVTTFQSGRHVNGGAENIGFATSRDGGTRWRSGFLPSLSAASSPPGPSERVSDPVVAYDALHRTWLIASLGVSTDRTSLQVSRSPDGLRWSRPVPAANDPEEDYDKEWITCDNGARSRFRGHCYLSYLDVASRQLRTRSSSDGGLFWSEPVSASVEAEANAIVNGAQPVVRPDGSLLVLFSVFGAVSERGDNYIGAVRSGDGGATFAPSVRVAALEEEPIPGMRSPALPSVEVDGGGRIFVAWHDCRFRDSCLANDIVLASSRDGVTWSGPRRVPVAAGGPEVDHFVPGLGVDSSTSGRRTRIAIAYHTLRPASGCFGLCGPGVDVSLIRSGDGGVTWSRPQRLSAESMQLAWIADTGIGRMLADYISTSFVRGRPVPVFAVAAPLVGDEFRQAIFATTTLKAGEPMVPPPAPSFRSRRAGAAR